MIFLSLTLLIVGCASNTDDKSELVKTEQIEKTILFEKITFPSLDSLPVTANLYQSIDDAPVIVLCHQARFNKFEYTKIAETLSKNGFTCLAIDQRSGGPIVETFNETMVAAVAAGKPVDYLDAEQDIIAAVNFMAKKYNKKVILWGSSYSSTLVLYVALENDNVAAVISFSPGDYFIEEKGSLKEKLGKLTKPMFVTSSKEEAVELTGMLEKVKMGKSMIHFVPNSAGAHGSRALWKTDLNNGEYWAAINAFLDETNKIY